MKPKVKLTREYPTRGGGRNMKDTPCANCAEKDAEIEKLRELLICELCNKPAESFVVCPACYDNSVISLQREPSVPTSVLQPLCSRYIGDPEYHAENLVYDLQTLILDAERR